MKRFWPVIERNPNYNPNAARAKPWLNEPRVMLLWLVVYLIEGALLILIIRGVNFLEQRIGIQRTQYVIAASVVSAGITAHFFRKAHRLLYGLIEVAFAGIAAIRISPHLQPQQILFTQWVALVGCAYVVARGLNNVSEARRKATNRAKAVSEGP